MYTPFVPKRSNNRMLILDWASIGYQTLFGLQADYKKTRKNKYKFSNSSKSMLYHKTGMEIDLTTPDGTIKSYRNAHFSRIIELVETFNPSKIIIALEGGRNWRYDVYPQYKMNRKDRTWEFVITPREFDDVRSQLASDVAMIFGAHSIRYKECEGDDIIATAVKLYSPTFDNITIVSGDGDMLQLSKYNNVDIYDCKGHEYKVPVDGAKVFLECKVLSGDIADNILGVQLPGKKTRLGKIRARKLYDQVSGNIYEEADRNGWLDQYMLNKQVIDMDFIPADKVDIIRQILINNKREFVDYIGMMEYDFTKINMNKVQKLMSMNIKTFDRSINTEYIYDDGYK